MRTVNILTKMVESKKAEVGDLESLARLLNFFNKAIFPGRAFTRRMYAKFSGKMLLHSDKSKNGRLQKHHHIQLDKEFKDDCRTWLSFLETGNVAVCHPYIDLKQNRPDLKTLLFYTDATQATNLGFGGIFNAHWMFGKWEHNYIERYEPSIEYLELFAVCAAVFAWSEELANLRFTLFCDNQSVVTMLNNSTSGCKNCMVLIRMLTLRSLKFNMRVQAKWVASKQNRKSDLLSRQKIALFLSEAKSEGCSLDCYPTPVPEELWLVSKLWVK